MSAKPSPNKSAPRQGQAARPTISCCMMVKNEEKRLPVALKSVKPWVDEIILVDTGSTDRTLEIAQEYGAKIFHHPWEYNFALHRNQSLSYASGDWLLVLDADEELAQETAPLLRKLVLAPPPINCFLFELYNAVAVGGETFILHPRLFRNHVGFRYEGQVHNRPMVPGQVSPSKVRLIHYGYNEDPATMAMKHQRRVDMIAKWIEKEPDNYLAHSYMAHTLVSQPESRGQTMEEGYTALRLLKELLTREQGQEYRYPHVYYPLINALCLLGHDEECLKQVDDCLRVAPYYPDPLFFSVSVHYKNGRWEEVCSHAAKFKQLQDAFAADPERFIFFENMSLDQGHQVYFRWVVAASQLERSDEAKAALGYLAVCRSGEDACSRAIQAVLALDQPATALELSAHAARLQPDWTWPVQMMELARQKMGESQGQGLREQGLAALGRGNLVMARQLLEKAITYNPLDSKTLFALAQAMDQAGQPQEAAVRLMAGLNLHPGQGQAWARLADLARDQGDLPGAAAAYRRALSLPDPPPELLPRLQQCLAVPPAPTVASRPPALVLFMVDDLTPEMARMPAPHFLMGRAWGELIPSVSGPQADAPNWATLLTGQSAQVHGLTGESTWSQPLSLHDLAVTNLFDALPPRMSLGMAAMPLGWPPPERPGWALAGYPFGLLRPDLARPASLALTALAMGYRSDVALTQLQEQSIADGLERDIRQEAFLYQMERNKIAAALAMPAVEVLVIGLRVLAHMRRAFELAHYRTFAAYQQVYAWIDTLLMALNPAHFAVISQRGPTRDRGCAAGGFYCLSWLAGEGAQARPEDVAPEIVKLLGGDVGKLGRGR